MDKRRKAIDEAVAQFWFDGLIEPARDVNGHVRCRNGEIVWVVTNKGAAYAGENGMIEGLARLREPAAPGVH
jgi:hypothetical protein